MVAVVRPPEFNPFSDSLQHVFSGGYAAGYYSYKWGEVLRIGSGELRLTGQVSEREEFAQRTLRHTSP